MDNAKKPEPQVKVKLLKVHTHERVERKVGDELTVREGLAKWLVDNEIAALVKA